MKHFIKILALFTGILFINSCITPKKIIIPDNEKNPTEYLFNISMNRMKWVIEATFEEQKYCGYFVDDSTSPFFRYIPNPEKNENDYFLWHNDYICRSKVYYSKYGKPRLYAPPYYFIHLEETEKGIKVYVYAIEPEVRVGWTFTSMHTIPGYGFTERFISVPSTTVEEYEILLMIGQTLGIEKEMPPLKIPAKIKIGNIL